MCTDRNSEVDVVRVACVRVNRTISGHFKNICFLHRGIIDSYANVGNNTRAYIFSGFTLNA